MAPTRADGRATRRQDRRAVGLVGVVALVSHMATWAAGVSIPATVLGPGEPGLDYQSWHLLPLDLLHHDLGQSLLHLDSQPPLFNLATAVLYRLPMHLFWARLGMVAFATSLALAACGLLVELGIGRRVSVGVVIVFVVLDPAQLLYPTWYFYGLPTAAVLTFAAWAATRWVRTRRLLPGIVFWWLVALVVLTNSAFQIYGFLIAAVPLLVVLRRQWRSVLVAALPPLLVVGAWYANDAVQFGTFTTSSWTGMNMARITTGLDTRADLTQLVDQHVLTPLALVRPFYPLGAYGALGHAPPTGIPALDVPTKLVTPNLNNIAYVAISKQFLTNDLHWVEHRPRLYAEHITEGIRIWLLPADQTPAVASLPVWPLHGWTGFYDHWVMLQTRPDPGADRAAVFGDIAPTLANVSWTLVVQQVLALVVLPVVAWRHRRRDPARAAAAGWIWIVTGVLTLTTSLLEVGENNRFRFELGALPLVGAVVAVAWLVEGLRGHRPGRTGAEPVPARAGSTGPELTRTGA